MKLLQLVIALILILPAWAQLTQIKGSDPISSGPGTLNSNFNYLEATKARTGRCSAGQVAVELSFSGPLCVQLNPNYFASTGRHGNGTAFQAFGTGTPAAGECAAFDALGNLTGSGEPCGLGPSVAWSGTYDSARTYIAGDVVVYQNRTYLATGPAGAGVTPLTSSWTPVFGLVWSGAYSSTGAYSAGSVVTSGGTPYLATGNAGIGVAPPASPWVAIAAAGGGATVTAKTCASDCSAGATDGVVLADTSTADVNIILPPTSTVGHRITIKWVLAESSTTFLSSCACTFRHVGGNITCGPDGPPAPNPVPTYPQVFILGAAAVDGIVIGTNPLTSGVNFLSFNANLLTSIPDPDYAQSDPSNQPSISFLWDGSGWRIDGTYPGGNGSTSVPAINECLE